MTNITITPEQRTAVATVINAGLVSGIGKPVPGQLCLEAAICLALGEPHGDRPSCVATPDRAYAIKLQDYYPGTPAQRAALFLPLGLAQLGTAGTDRGPWVAYVVEHTIRRIVPVALRAAAKLNPEHSEKLEAAAVRCEAEGTKEAAANAYDAATATVAYAADAATVAYAAYAARASSIEAIAYAAAGSVAYGRIPIFELAVAIALEAYALEGRHP